LHHFRQFITIKCYSGIVTIKITSIFIIARLVEKWFISEKLGHDFWKISSEEYYKKNQAKYYETINLGVNFYELNYDKCVDFLEMLPNCLK